ncbi:unnamed protein product, partial [Ectocarpus fasciculatus]
SPLRAAEAAARAIVASGGVRTAADAAQMAELFRQRMNAEQQAARKLTEDVGNAKDFSERNNKAAMWRVETATRFKDRLVMANDLITGYRNMQRDAVEEMKAAMAEETRAVARFRKAQAQATALLEATAGAGGAARPATIAATGSPSWNNDSSSTSSNGSSNGGATTSSASSSGNG